MSQLMLGAGVQLGPLMLGTLIKHYISRKNITQDSKARDEFLYDQAFSVIRFFLEEASKYGVEELQTFSNTRIPAPPTVTSIRLLIPLSCCDEAATILIKALGGEEMAKKVAGGTRWWQVRGIPGIDANWIANKKDWNKAARTRATSDAKRRESVSSFGDSAPSGTGVETEESGTYTAELDPMRCMLYFHGGGYFFGSTDQERFCVQRYSRKMNGRVFAVNYRLAPQYPFPCQIQDAIAAYLYLIRPPPGALHKPVAPEQIILNGDSAGGGLVLALLQVIRDQGLPMPAGAILVSPWCDLTHSFPSTMENTSTDIIPRYGLSIYKPSTLWPPPSDEMVQQVRRTLTERVKSAVGKVAGHRHEESGASPSGAKGPHTVQGDTLISEQPAAKNANGVSDAEGATADAEKSSGQDALNQMFRPMPTERGQPIVGIIDGKEYEMRSQIQLYAMNHQLTHPLISPVLGYLGGLCPLFVMASDKEVLRDEIIFTAHKAANPSKYPLKPEIVDLYPAYKGIEERYGPTDVHLQVYDETCHVLPLFTFTTPAIYSYRAMAAFCKFVTKSPVVRSPSLSSVSRSAFIKDENPSPLAPMAESPEHEHHGFNFDVSPSTNTGDPKDLSISVPLSDSTKGEVAGSGSSPVSASDSDIVPSKASDKATAAEAVVAPGTSLTTEEKDSTSAALETPKKESAQPATAPVPPPVGTVRSNSVSESRPRVRRLTSSFFRRASSVSSRRSSVADSELPETPVEPWARNKSAHPELETHGTKSEAGYAGHATVYADVGGLPFPNHIIRERVATNGLIRPLEPESELVACNWPLEMTGVITENAAKRYLEGQAKWDAKYASAALKVARQREKHIKAAQKDTAKQIEKLQKKLAEEKPRKTNGNGVGEEEDPSGHTLLNAPRFSFAWALQGEEPPPSSLVARRDNAEARRLARIADVHLDESESRVSGNNVWSILTNLLGGSS